MNKKVRFGIANLVFVASAFSQHFRDRFPINFKSEILLEFIQEKKIFMVTMKEYNQKGDWLINSGPGYSFAGKIDSLDGKCIYVNSKKVYKDEIYALKLYQNNESEIDFWLAFAGVAGLFAYLFTTDKLVGTF